MVKEGAAGRFAGDPDASRYAEAKEPWLAAAYPRATAWAAATGWRPAAAGIEDRGTVGGSA